VRNNIINSLFYKKDKSVVITLVKKILQAISSIKYISQKHGFLKCKVIWQGTLEGLFQYRKFKSYIENQLSND
jgi:hypothetical protein